MDSPRIAHTLGMIAPPAMPTISRAEPVRVNLPNPSMANGQIAGQIKALANPSKAMNRTDMYPSVNMARALNIKPNTADPLSAVD